jgi:hypothetical protein
VHHRSHHGHGISALPVLRAGANVRLERTILQEVLDEAPGPRRAVDLGLDLAIAHPGRDHEISGIRDMVEVQVADEDPADLRRIDVRADELAGRPMADIEQVVPAFDAQNDAGVAAIRVG